MFTVPPFFFTMPCILILLFLCLLYAPLSCLAFLPLSWQWLQKSRVKCRMLRTQAKEPFYALIVVVEAVNAFD